MKETERIVDVYESVLEGVGDIILILTTPLTELDPDNLPVINSKKQNKINSGRLTKVRERYLRKDYRYVKRENLRKTS